MRSISADHGLCGVCHQWKPTVSFKDEEPGYDGYYVEFEICKECFVGIIDTVKQ